MTERPREYIERGLASASASGDQKGHDSARKMNLSNHFWFTQLRHLQEAGTARNLADPLVTQAAV